MPLGLAFNYQEIRGVIWRDRAEGLFNNILEVPVEISSWVIRVVTCSVTYNLLAFSPFLSYGSIILFSLITFGNVLLLFTNLSYALLLRKSKLWFQEKQNSSFMIVLRVLLTILECNFLREGSDILWPLNLSKFIILKSYAPWTMNLFSEELV